MKIQEVLRDELGEIAISEEEEKNMLNQVEDILSKLKKAGLSPFIGGSLAKGTIIKKDVQDVDIFIVFDKNEDLLNLKNKLEKIGLDFEIMHGSRDYFQVRKDGVILELIPVLKIYDLNNIENVTDLSLMHVDYIKREINKNKKLANQIKLAKAFCYAQNCYGAESYIQGFSGYALEILVIYFNGFANFLKKIQNTKIIDPKKQYKNSNEIQRELNESKLVSPIILIDPTFKMRNVTAGLSNETFNRFISTAKKFLKKPSQDFFEREIIDIQELEKIAKKHKAKFYQIEFTTDKQEGDIAATKMKKFFSFIANELKKHGQNILYQKFVYEGGQDALAYLILKKCNEIKIKGPPIKLKEAVKAFKLNHKKTSTKKGFIYAKKLVYLEEIFNRIKSLEDEMQVRFEFLSNYG